MRHTETETNFHIWIPHRQCRRILFLLKHDYPLKYTVMSALSR